METNVDVSLSRDDTWTERKQRKTYAAKSSEGRVDAAFTILQPYLWIT